MQTPTVTVTHTSELLGNGSSFGNDIVGTGFLELCRSLLPICIWLSGREA
jgi:hypothetical protein